MSHWKASRRTYSLAICEHRPGSETWEQFKEVSLGRIEVRQSGEQTVSIRPNDAGKWRAMSLRFVKLTKAEYPSRRQPGGFENRRKS